MDCDQLLCYCEKFFAFVNRCYESVHNWTIPNEYSYNRSEYCVDMCTNWQHASTIHYHSGKKFINSFNFKFFFTLNTIWNIFICREPNGAIMFRLSFLAVRPFRQRFLYLEAQKRFEKNYQKLLLMPLNCSNLFVMKPKQSHWKINLHFYLK